MNKYQIKDKKTGVVTNEWTDDVLPADHYEPCFGLKERWKWYDECSAEEIAGALEIVEVETVPAIDDNPAIIRKNCRLPQTFEVIVTDMTPVLQAEAAKKSQINTLRQRVKTILQKADADVTAAEVREVLLKFLRQAALRGDLD